MEMLQAYNRKQLISWFFRYFGLALVPALAICIVATLMGLELMNPYVIIPALLSEVPALIKAFKTLPPMEG